MIVRVRPNPAGFDRYGDTQAVSERRDEIEGAFVAPRSSAAFGDIEDRGREGVTQGLTLFAPATTDIAHTDQVEVDGVLYDIDGDVARWVNPFTGWQPGVTVALVRAAG